MERKPPTPAQRQEAKGWNNWKPGTGRRGWSPFGKPIPPTCDAATGHPIGEGGRIDWRRVIEKANHDS